MRRKEWMTYFYYWAVGDPDGFISVQDFILQHVFKDLEKDR
jgi:hypothetical protein